MKKVIALLLAAVMCLSLAACGGEKYVSDEEFLSYLEVIELTQENCNEYFEINEVEEVDDFGELTGDKYLGIKLKDEYILLSDKIVVKVTGVESTITKRKNEQTGEWELSDPNGNAQVESFEIDENIYYSSDGYSYLLNTTQYFDELLYETTITDVKIANVKGSIALVNIPDNLWKTSESGIPYFRVGSKDYSTVVEDKPDDPLWVKMDLHKAAKYAMERQGIIVE